MNTVNALSTGWGGVGLSLSLGVIGKVVRNVVTAKVALLAALFFAVCTLIHAATESLVHRGWIYLSTAANIRAFSATSLTALLVATTFFMIKGVIALPLLLGALFAALSVPKIASSLHHDKLLQECLVNAEKYQGTTRENYLNCAYNELCLAPKNQETLNSLKDVFKKYGNSFPLTRKFARYLLTHYPEEAFTVGGMIKNHLLSSLNDPQLRDYAILFFEQAKSPDSEWEILEIRSQVDPIFARAAGKNKAEIIDELHNLLPRVCPENNTPRCRELRASIGLQIATEFGRNLSSAPDILKQILHQFYWIGYGCSYGQLLGAPRANEIRVKAINLLLDDLRALEQRSQSDIDKQLAEIVKELALVPPLETDLAQHDEFLAFFAIQAQKLGEAKERIGVAKPKNVINNRSMLIVDFLECRIRLIEAEIGPKPTLAESLQSMVNNLIPK